LGSPVVPEVSELGAEIVPDYPNELAGIMMAAAAGGLKLTRQVPGSATAGRSRLNLARIDQIGNLDTVSRTITVQAGLPMTLLENYLQEKGLTLGFIPRHLMGLNVGEYLSVVSPCHGSPRFGTVRQNCLGLEGCFADGTVFSSRTAPRRAAGPDLRFCLIGAGGVNGVITSATLRVFPVPAVREAVAFGTSDPVAAVAAVRTLIQRGVRPEWVLVVTRAPGDIGSRKPARLALQLGGDRQEVGRGLEVLDTVMEPLGLSREPVSPDLRLHASVELHEARELFLETGPLMTLLGEIAGPGVPRGPEAPEIHVTYFCSHGATIRVLLREPGQAIPAAFLREYAAHASPILDRLGRKLSERLDPGGIFAEGEKYDG